MYIIYDVPDVRFFIHADTLLVGPGALFIIQGTGLSAPFTISNICGFLDTIVEIVDES
jgi:hypothetical protein